MKKQILYFIMGICLIVLPLAGVVISSGCGGGSDAGAADDDDDNDNNDDGPPEGASEDPGEIAAVLAGTYDIVTTRADDSTETGVLILELNEAGELVGTREGEEIEEEEGDDEALSFSGWVLDNEFSIEGSFTEEMPGGECTLTATITIAGELNGNTLTATRTVVASSEPAGCAWEGEGEGEEGGMMFEEGETVSTIAGTKRAD